MTSGVVIFKKELITVAIDKVTTIGQTVTIDDTDKIFSIHNDLPIVIIIYGLSTVEDVPIETLIADFKKEIKIADIITINDLKEKLLNFISKRAPIHDFKNDIEFNLEVFKKDIGVILDDMSKSEFDEFIDVYSNFKIFDYIRNLDEYEDYDNTFKRLVLPNMPNNSWLALKNFFFMELFDTTGIIIAGYNLEDNFPSYIQFEILANTSSGVEITFEKSEFNFDENKIIPIAQSDVINSFLKGQHEDVEDITKYYFEIFLKNYLNSIKLDILSVEGIDESALSKINKIFDIYSEYSNNDISDVLKLISNFKENMALKTTDALDFLTKERLAEMAETLVNLTALKREASYDLNTVGGDIDVVLISKFENITWLKKEKYFKKYLNK